MFTLNNKSFTNTISYKQISIPTAEQITINESEQYEQYQNIQGPKRSS